MQRPDLRQIAGNIREALGDCDHETLLDMLTFVFKEYVVEGPPPLLVSQAERIADLEGLSFPDLIRALQTRLDLPELGLFQVDGNQVSVRVSGVMTPLDASAARTQAALAAAAPPEPAPPQQQPRPVAGVQVVETNFTRVPARVSAPEPERAQPAAQSSSSSSSSGAGSPAGQAPPPRRGLSVRGQPSGDEAPARPSAAAPREAQPSQAQPAQQPPQQQGGEPAPRDSGPRSERDSAAERFSLLELD